METCKFEILKILPSNFKVCDFLADFELDVVCVLISVVVYGVFLISGHPPTNTAVGSH